MVRRGWKQWDEEQTQRELHEFHASGEERTAFARSRGYSPERLRRWAERLKVEEVPCRSLIPAAGIASSPNASSWADSSSLAPGPVDNTLRWRLRSSRCCSKQSTSKGPTAGLVGPRL